MLKALIQDVNRQIPPRQGSRTSSQSDSSSDSSSTGVQATRTADETAEAFRRNSVLVSTNDGSVSTPRRTRETGPLQTDRYERATDDLGYAWVNNYIMIAGVGKGTYGRVKLGVHATSGESVALKVCNKKLLGKRRKGGAFQGRRTYLEDVRREIALMKKISHENLVNLIEVIDDPSKDKLYIVLEYLEGGALLRESTIVLSPNELLSEGLAQSYFRDVVCGLHYLHSLGIVHRDIKPQNLLKTKTGRIKIGDFSVSMLLDGQAEGERMAGSPFFLAPEVINSDLGPITQAVDIWALAATFFQLLVGRPPFYLATSNEYQLYELIQNEPLVFPDPAAPDAVRKQSLSAPLQQMLSSMMDKNLSRRTSIAELAQHPWVTSDGHLPLTIPEHAPAAVEPNALELSQAYDRLQPAISQGVTRKLTRLSELAREKVAKLRVERDRDCWTPNSLSTARSGNISASPSTMSSQTSLPRLPQRILSASLPVDAARLPAKAESPRPIQAPSASILCSSSSTSLM